MELVLKSAEINLPQSIANLEALKAELAPKLEQYNSLVVTEDSIKAAKADKANLNKLRTAIEDQRKAAKKQYLEPYTILEAQCKEVVALIDAPIGAIDKQLKAFDEKEKAEKYNELEAFFSTVQRETFIELQDVINPKWANKTEKVDSLKAEIEAACQKFHDEYEQLNKLYENFPHKLAIIDKFKSTKDFSQTMVYAKNLEFEALHFFIPASLLEKQVILLRYSSSSSKSGWYMYIAKGPLPLLPSQTTVPFSYA